jgi:hypothetical protein
MTTREEAREEALKLFDAGIPNEIERETTASDIAMNIM